MVFLSVIIPIYNVETYLSICLDSLTKQNVKDVEYICVDDGSTDGSLEICEKYARTDSRFRVITQKNGGPAKARNHALDLALGDYICFVDSDDYLEPGALEKLSSLASKKDYDIIVYGANVIAEGDIPDWVSKSTSPRDIEYDDFKFKITFKEEGCRPFLWQHFIRSDLIQKNKLRMDENLFIGEDQAFEIVYFSRAKKVLFTSEKLYNYRLSRPESQMGLWSSNLKGKMWQHLKMASYVISEIKGDIGPDEELVLILWVIETIYWDMSKLLYYDQAEYVFYIFELLDDLNFYNHYEELSNFDKVRFKHLETIYLHHGEPDKIIKSMEDIGRPIHDVVLCFESNKILSLFRLVRKYLGV